MTSLEVLGDFLFLRNGFGDQFLQLRRVERRYLFLNFVFENRANLARAVEVFLKGDGMFLPDKCDTSKLSESELENYKTEVGLVTN